MSCYKCRSDINPDDNFLLCSQCDHKYHLKCLTNVAQEDYDYIVSSGASWKCGKCELVKIKRGDETPLTPTSEKIGQFRESGNDSESSTGSINKQSCNKCHKGFAHNALRVVCKVCKITIHLKCTEPLLSKEEYTKVKQSWLCGTCFMDPVKPARASGYATDKTQMQADKITLSDILAEMLTFRKEVKQTSKDMSDNIQKYSDWIEDIDKKMEGVAQKLDSVVANIDVLFQENVNLKKTVHELTKKVNTLEQDAKDKVLEINGVPLKNNEDVMELVSKVSEAIGFQFDERKIDNCYRYKPAVPGSNGPA
ncbi:hypothetical protein J6590_106866, partial [Homalodisca vitripennis]